MSVLIHSSLDYQEIECVSDTEGRFVILLCRIYTLKYILAFVYIPPPYHHQVLKIVLEYQLCHHDIPIYIMGDFNCVLDPALDKHHPVGTLHDPYHTPLSKLMEEVGWTDPWHDRDPGDKCYFCFTKSRMSLSRIDLSICSATVSRHISEITYAVRSISDHSPVITSLELRPISSMVRAPWKLNAFWLNLLSAHAQIGTKIENFWRVHRDQAAMERSM